jgi:hypothetical protein
LKSNTKTTEETEKKILIFLRVLCVFSAFSAVIFLAIENKYKNHRANREGNDIFPPRPLRLLRFLCG